jgi:nitronate monooxygenase
MLPKILRGRLAVPVIASPMFILSTPDLVVAQCTAGVVGSFPALNARPAEALEGWLTEIETRLAAWDAAHPDRPSAPYAVNMIVHRSNPRLEQDMAACLRHKTPIIITSLGARADVFEAVHSYGGIVLHDVISDAFAKKAIEKGADGLIGTISPFALVQEIRAWFNGPLALSGAIANGGAILAAQAMGADLAYIGSAFIATEEANAAAAYKQAIVDGAAKDIVYSSLFTGVHGNYLRASIIAAGLDPDHLGEGDPSQMNFAAAGPKPKAWKDVWGSGQGIGAIHDIIPAGERIARLRNEYLAARARILN